MTDDRAGQDVLIARVRAGMAFEAVLPNLGTAGYRWRAEFDPKNFEKLAVDRSPSAPHQVVFRFKALAASGVITFKLARSGCEAEQTKVYSIIVDP